MIDDSKGRIDYDEIAGRGETVVLLPGSCSTGAAWRPVMGAWNGRYRCITTSLPGYGGTAERRSSGNTDIGLLAEAMEAVVRRAGGPVHLVGHSFGGLVGLAMALRGLVPLASLTIIEAPAVDILHSSGDVEGYGVFQDLIRRYFAAFEAGEAEAITHMVDFYGGAGTFASWPERLRAYAMATTGVNIVDWHSACGVRLSADNLGAVAVPVQVMFGEHGNMAVQRANQLLGALIAGARVVPVAGASHFMIATHPAAVADAIARHIDGHTGRAADLG